MEDNQISIDRLPEPPRVYATDHDTLLLRQRAFGYTDEDLKMILGPMAVKGEEPVGSMGTDTPLACLSDKPQSSIPLLQAAVRAGDQPGHRPDPRGAGDVADQLHRHRANILAETPQHAHLLKLQHPILTNRDLEKLRRVSWGDFLAYTLPMLYNVHGGEQELERAGFVVQAGQLGH
jgi:glutamate synthase (NADPH) large chain